MATEFENVICAVCGSDDTTQISVNGQFGLPANVCVCNQCGLSYLNPRWTKERYSHFYAKEYDKYYRKQVIDDDGSRFNPDEHEKNPYGYYPVYLRIKENMSSVKNILDLGAGNGDNIRYLMAKMPEVNAYAIESSEKCVDTLTRNNVTVIGQDIDASWEDQLSDKMDLVIMRHVFEHMLDPVAALRKIKKSLRSDGLLYIAVPNAMKILDPMYDNFLRVVHTYYYSPLSITNLLHMGGFEVVELVEGDEHNQREMWVLARSVDQTPEPIIDHENAKKQIDYYMSKIKPEKAFSYTFRRSLRNNVIAPIIRLKKAIVG